MKYILITTAIIEEAEYIITRLANRAETKVGNKTVISGIFDNKEIKIAITGPGIINSAHAITAVIQQDCPKLIIQTGCAGGFKQVGLKIGDICIADKEIDAHLGIEAEDKNCLPRQLSFPLYKDDKKEIISSYSTDLKLSQKAEDILKKKFCDTLIMRGKFITVSTITATDKTAQKYFNAFNCIAENMEGAASAFIALIYNIPFIEIRAISNLCGKRDKGRWDLKTAFEKSGKAVCEIISNI